MQTIQANPLFGSDDLPRFEEITPAHIVPAFDYLIPATLERLEQLEAAFSPTWAGLEEPLQNLVEPVDYAWHVVNHLLSVANSDELRDAHAKVQPRIVELDLRIKQSTPLYQGAKAMQASDGWNALDEAQRRAISHRIQAAELAGIALTGAALERFKEIAGELAQLTTKFKNNLLDAVKEFHLDLVSKEDIVGLPATLLAAAAQAAAAGGLSREGEPPTAEEGPWRITLDLPMVLPFLENSLRRDLREVIYRASITKASQGEFDNTPIIDQILRLRREKAQLLGFQTYAEFSLADKMAGSVDAVEALLEEVRNGALPKARTEYDDLRNFAQSDGGSETELAHWDFAFWFERVREKRYDYNDEDLRPYFPLPHVLDGLFGITNKVFGARFEAADGEAQVWDPSVRFFNVLDPEGRKIASFYLDPYSRPSNKRGGAWMDVALERKKQPDGTVRLPVAYLNCNQAPPVGDQPSLMSFTELRTLFHEFGHGLQHVLTKVDYPQVAGLAGIEWDAIEICSTFMENWLFQPDVLKSLSKHHVTGDQLPDETVSKIISARTFRSGVLASRQIDLSEIDLELYHRFDPDDSETIFDRHKKVAKRNLIVQPLDEDRMLCGFSHIFSGGYAAGYYSYLWASVLAADAFGAFREVLDDEAELAKVGGRFRDTILALGGGRHPMDVFHDFRGRAPSTDALLVQLGFK